jgi:hypothetical protein
MALSVYITPDICKSCQHFYTIKESKWCKPCQIKKFEEISTSGNEEIDNLIKERLLEIESHESKIFEWIPYNKLNIIRETGRRNCPVAIWNEGPLKFNSNTTKYKRVLDEKVALMYEDSSLENIIYKVIN